MADEVDVTGDRLEKEMGIVEEAIRRAAAEIPVGEPGECDHCGEFTQRLVGGACAPCRDKYKLG